MTYSRENVRKDFPFPSHFPFTLKLSKWQSNTVKRGFQFFQQGQRTLVENLPSAVTPPPQMVLDSSMEALLGC